MSIDRHYGLYAFIFIVFSLIALVLLYYAQSPDVSSTNNRFSACMYEVNVSDDSGELLSKAECDANKIITVYSVASYNLDSINYTVDKYKVVLVRNVSGIILENIYSLIGLSSIDFGREPSSIVLYHCGSSICVLYLSPDDEYYIANYIELGYRVSRQVQHPSILLPVRVNDVPSLYSVSILERDVASKSNISGPNIVSYNRTLNLILTLFIGGCLERDIAVSETVKVITGGILADYKPSTSYSPLHARLPDGTVLESNFTGVYKDRSDFSQDLARWVIEVSKCKGDGVQVISSYVSIGKTSGARPTWVLIGLDTGGDRVDLMLKD